MTQSQQAWLVHFVGDPTEKEVRQQINKSKCGKQRGGRGMAQAFPNHKRNEMHGNGAVACNPLGQRNEQQPENRCLDDIVHTIIDAESSIVKLTCLSSVCSVLL